MIHSLSFTRRVVLAGLFAAAFSGAASPALAQPAAGSRLILAGLEASRTADFWQHFMTAAGKGATIYIIPTAADDPVKAANALAASVKKAGGTPVIVPLAGVDLLRSGKNPFGDTMKLLNDYNWQKEFGAGKAFLFADGNPDRLARTLLEGETDDGPLLVSMKKSFEAGAVIGIIGDSVRVAGTAGFRRPRPFSQMVRFSMQWELDYSYGLGLAPEQWLVDYGVGSGGNLPRLILAQANLNSPASLGLETQTIIEIDRAAISFAGSAPGTLVKLPEAPKAASSAIVPYSVSIFNPGDRFTIANGTVTFDPKRKTLDVPVKAVAAEMIPDATAENAFVGQVQQIGLGKAGKTTLVAADWQTASTRQAKAHVYTVAWGDASKAASDGTATSVANISGTLVRDQFLAFPVYQETENE